MVSKHLLYESMLFSLVRDFMIVDTPGMIDSPETNDRKVMDRGYDFEGVCRWYAERADVILLFFDPDKPGKLNSFMFFLLFDFFACNR
jgi:hypothetical protein